MEQDTIPWYEQYPNSLALTKLKQKRMKWCMMFALFFTLFERSRLLFYKSIHAIIRKQSRAL